MRYLEMTDEERRERTRHRVTRSMVHRLATTVAVTTVVVLATAVLGWTGTPEAGLREARATDASWETDRAEPAMRRTVDLPEPRRVVAAKPPARPDRAIAVPSGAAAPPASEPPPSPAPPRPTAPTVRHGDPCAAEGATGRTRSGTPVVCTASPGNGRTRWRHA